MISREEWINNFRFVEYKEWHLEKPATMLVAVPDTGLVGVIGASYLASKLGLEEVGGVDSPYLPPIAIVSNGMLRLPIRVFTGSNLAVIYTETAMGLEAMSALTSALVDYARLKGINMIVGLTGVPKPNRLDVTELTTYYVSSMGRSELAEQCGAKTLEAGMIVGPFATLLKESVRKRFHSILFLTESFLEFPDPEAAAVGLRVISRFLNIEIDVGGLIEQAELIRLRARDLMARASLNMLRMGKELEYGVPLHM